VNAVNTSASALDNLYAVLKDKRTAVPPRIVTDVPRLSDALIERYRSFYIPDISDAIGSLYTMDAGIRPFYEPIKRLVGRAFTVKAPPGDNISIRGALGLVQAGDVLVIDWRGYTGACGSGAGALTVPMARGLAGLIIDGAWRDTKEIQRLDFPLFSRGVNAYSPVRRRPGEINVPVSCGGVVVHPGDLIVADCEGIVAVPFAYAERVADALAAYEPKRDLQDWIAGQDLAQTRLADAYTAFVEDLGG
jgi:4-hydroxy-4-methyl-2-oxoglutarate aldolase